MRVDLSLKNIRRTRILGDVLEKDVEKLQRHVKVFGESPIHLELRLEKSPHKNEYEGWASLYVPKKVFRVHEHAEDKLTLVNSMTKTIIRQLDKFTAKYDHQHRSGKRSTADVASEAFENEINIEEDVEFEEGVKVV